MLKWNTKDEDHMVENYPCVVMPSTVCRVRDAAATCKDKEDPMKFISLQFGLSTVVISE